MSHKVSPSWKRWMRRHGFGVTVGGLTALLLVLSVAGQQITSSRTIALEGWTGFQGQPDDADAQALQDARRHMNDLLRQHSDREQELKRNFKGKKIDTSSVRTLLDSWKGALGQLQQTLNTGDTNAFWDQNGDMNENFQQPVNDKFQELYTQQDYANFNQEFKNYERQLKDMGRSVLDIKKRGKGKVDTTVLEQFIADYRKKLDAVKAAHALIQPNDPDLQDKMSDIRNETAELSTNEFYDVSNELNELANRESQKKDILRILKEKDRGKKDRARQLKQLVRAKLDITELNAIAGQIDALVGDMKKLLDSPDYDTNEFWDANSELGELEMEFQNRSSALNDGLNVKRTLKDKARTLKDMDREYKRERNPSKEAAELLEELRALYAQMQQFTPSPGEDMEEGFWSPNRTFDNLTGEFWNTLHPPGGGEIESLEAELPILRQQLEGMVSAGGKSAKQAKQCLGYVGQAEALVQAVLKGDEEKQQELEAIGKNFDAAGCEKLVGE